MSMTSGDELGKSNVFVTLAVALFPLAEEAMRQGMTMKEFERGLLGGLLCTGKRVVDQFLIAQGDGDLGETATHPVDHGDEQTIETRTIYRSSEVSARVLRTVFGEHEFSAYIYRDGDDRRCPIVCRPVDEQLGISPDRYSPLLQEYSMLLCCEQAFHGAVDAFQRVFRHRLSTDTLEKISQRMGAAADEFLLERAAPPKSEEGQQRRKEDQVLVRLMDGQHSLWSDADACPGDGGSDNVIDILDIVHVSGYVGKAAKVLCRGQAAQEAFIRQRLLRILQGEVQAVIRGVRRLATLQNLPGEKRAEVESTCGYFAAHAHRMKYDEYLAAGLPIATGVIEGACRHLVKDRLERSGMRWSTDGAQAMLSLRSLKASNAWDEFQTHFLNPISLNA